VHIFCKEESLFADSHSEKPGLKELLRKFWPSSFPVTGHWKFFVAIKTMVERSRAGKREQRMFDYQPNFKDADQRG